MYMYALYIQSYAVAAYVSLHFKTKVKIPGEFISA